MDAEQCQERATECAANALIATDETVAQEFLKLAAQWRAMAVRTIVLGPAHAFSAGSSALDPAARAIRLIEVGPSDLE